MSIPNRLSRNYINENAQWVLREVYDYVERQLEALIDKDGLVWGDVKLTPEQAVQFVMQNALSGVGEVKREIAPKMYAKDMAALREGLKKMYPEADLSWQG